ncbi:ABC transporter permease [Nocardioides bruguierae]|uniref:ABC transporter permease n=1 Tax=Nocardioides bruguierae TaxID=2945102 RepID=A0A9X2D612_9ACTN|nr:ABC-2 family transporter protein [Nocardioides bruguierae]MCL8025829.1 ABC transporter permease [Nocardioides bruguierae]MCM0618944.1 ABC transporter permease [Nocardioides bruguierae]
MADVLAPARPRPAAVLRHARTYLRLAAAWVRSSYSYRLSFWLMVLSSFAVNAIEFLAVVFIFANVPDLGGFSLREVAFLYGTTGVPMALANLLVGSVEDLGRSIRTGTLDQMLVRPVPLLVQVCSDRFALRRVGRLGQAVAVLVWAGLFVDWSPAAVLLTLVALLAGTAIFFGIFVGFAAIQFWTADAAEVANAFTYGGSSLTQYPLTIYPRELVAGLTFLVPVAFVNWYPALLVLDRPEASGYPGWLGLASPVVAALVLALAGLVWRLGVRHYRSTGS